MIMDCYWLMIGLRHFVLAIARHGFLLRLRELASRISLSKCLRGGPLVAGERPPREAQLHFAT
jgi:hypothetical protein